MLQSLVEMENVEVRRLSRELSSDSGWKSRAIWVLAAVTVLGLVGRIVLSWFSLGSDDFVIWQGFANSIDANGFFKSYELDSNLNHPPLPFLWSWIALHTAYALHEVAPFIFSHVTRSHWSGPAWMSDGFRFPFIFRLATITTDVGCCILLYRIAKRRGGSRLWGWLAAAAYAWNLNAILDGAYHCNTDSLCAFFTLLAAYQLADRRNFFLGGLALAAAINVKIVPVLLIPALFSTCRDWKSAWQFIKGMLIGTIPFLVVICVTPRAFLSNVFCYNSYSGGWGLILFPLYATDIHLIRAQAYHVLNWFHLYGKYPLLAIAAGLGILSWARPRWNAYELGALGWCVFMIFTPGWGLQYTIYVTPLLMAASLGRGSLYGFVGGLYMLSAYAGACDGTLPIQSLFGRMKGSNYLPFMIGAMAWCVLVSFFFVTLWRGLLRNSIQFPARHTT